MEEKVILWVFKEYVSKFRGWYEVCCVFSHVFVVLQLHFNSDALTLVA